MDSIERLVRRNAFEHARLFANASERSNVYTRIETLGRHDRMVGFAWSALREAFYGDHASCLLFVEYESFTRDPEKTLSRIYAFIEEEPYSHDFENVAYEEPEFDRLIGVKGLHKVTQTVEFKPRKTILPPDLFNKYDKLSFWKENEESGLAPS